MVGGGAAAVEQARGAEHEGARADRDDAGDGRVVALEPARERGFGGRQRAKRRTARDEQQIGAAAPGGLCQRPGAAEQQAMPGGHVTAKRRDELEAVRLATEQLVGVAQHLPRAAHIEQL
jgi:hypothetical protein